MHRRIKEVRELVSANVTSSPTLLAHGLLGLIANDFCCPAGFLDHQKPCGPRSDPLYLRVFMTRHDEEQKLIRANALIDSGFYFEPF